MSRGRKFDKDPTNYGTVQKTSWGLCSLQIVNIVILRVSLLEGVVTTLIFQRRKLRHSMAATLNRDSWF